MNELKFLSKICDGFDSILAILRANNCDNVSIILES